MFMEYLILAYLGDAVYELIVRNHLINKGIKNVNDLQTESLNFVSAKSQRKLLEKLEQENILTEDELMNESDEDSGEEFGAYSKR